MLFYNPLIQPFELPVQKLVAHCISEAPLYFPPSEGATPGTTLCGTFGQVLCNYPNSSVVPWLYKPYSEVHHRNFARPVLLRAKELESTEPVDVFSLEVTLWGRHAIAAQDVVVDARRWGNLALMLIYIRLLVKAIFILVKSCRLYFSGLGYGRS
jgi:hypothetical protein